MSQQTGAPRIRPVSAGKNGALQKNGTGMASYEDMLVAQYLEELQKAPLKYSLTGGSPYAQSMGGTHIVPISNNVNGRPRPYSAVARPSSGRQKVDHNLWDTGTPHNDNRKRRPISAPVYKSRPISATASSVGSRPWSAKSGSRRVKPLYKRQPHTIVVTAYKNGSRDTFARITAPNLKTLLEMCTEKLELGNAARRLFLESGKEVFMARELARDCDIYVSTGEPFKNPYTSIKNHQEQQKKIAWTMHGLIWTSDVRKKPRKIKLSKRFQSLIEPSCRRVLVFKNGSGTDGIEIVADPDRLEEFLTACTAKLALTSYARVLFDLEGNPVTDLKQAAMLDPCLQTWSTPVLGPLWVSKGEGFSPSGVNDFLQAMITYTKTKLAEAKEYLEELQKAKEERKDEVKIAAILSMGQPEIEEALEIVNKDIEDFTNALNHLKGQMRKLQGEVQQEENERSHYKLSHIEQIDTEHRLVGSKGLRIKVYENGTYEDPCILYFNLTQATRGISHDQKKLMERLLDQCSNSHYLNTPKTNTALKPVAQKIFDKFGKDIRNVYDLEYDSEVWLSFGEPWKNPFTFVLTAVYDKARGYEIEGMRRIAREQLMIEDVSSKDSWSQWEAFTGWPEDQKVRVFEAGNPMDMGELDHVQGLLETGELPNDASFLRHKENQNLLLFGDIVMDNKKKKGSKDIWPSDAQVWLITEDGYIRNKAFPKLVLAVSRGGVSCNLTHPLRGVQDSRLEGSHVWLERMQDNAFNQQWFFSTEGHISPKSNPEMALTYVGMRFGDEESAVMNESDSAIKGLRPYLAVCEKLTGRASVAQRWAIKQERMDNVGQWKHTIAENPEWNKRALSWPVNEKGEINEKFDWPMEGYLMPYAPPLTVEKKTTTNVTTAPLRLTVLKNGVRDVTKAVLVVGPDLSNMKKDNKRKTKVKGKKKEVADNESLQEDMNVLKLEFTLFLERATGMLDLPFAARRLFDSEGREHFTLHTLTRDQLVYVSCGEPWSDPNLSKAEQQRRYLLANLASDVMHMRQFMALRNPQNLVLEVEGGLSIGNRLVVNETTSQDDDVTTEAHPVVEDDSVTANAATVDTHDHNMTHHELSHQRAEDRYEKRRWPWERQGANNDNGPENNDNNIHYSNRSRPKSQRRGQQTEQLQKFVHAEGFICCHHDNNLVLGVKEVEGHISEVVLCRRKPDEVFQRWIVNHNGIVQSKANPNLVLTVSLPTPQTREELGDLADMTYVGSQVILAPIKKTQFGRANQMWHFDENNGLILAFHTDSIDKEVTAANKANVCTFAVMGGTEVDQPGYAVDVGNEKGTKKKPIVCSSCARAMRGRYKLERLERSVDFACSMADAKSFGIKQIGSFKCLNGKVDLSTYEAELTLQKWEGQLEKLRSELSVKAIAKEISAAKVPYTAKVLAYKNGEGRIKPGELIIGSSIEGILQQCTRRLHLTQAARRLYTEDGMVILDLNDLVEWMQDHYVEQATQELRENDMPPDKQEEGLMSKVDLDETEGDTDTSNANQDNSDKAFAMGYQAVNDRPFLDNWLDTIVIPNPAEEIEHDGNIVVWSLYTNGPGTIFLQVLRQSEDNLNQYSLVDQLEFNSEAAGEYTIDMMSIANTRWQGKGMTVSKGDVIGFYCPGQQLLMYDKDETVNQAPLSLVPREPFDIGTTLQFSPIDNPAMRAYSLNAIIIPSDGKKPAVNGQPKRPSGSAKKDKVKKVAAVEKPPVGLVLRFPMEVWVSSGEAFIKPEKVERKMQLVMRQREERASVAYELEKEKHVLRQLQGRRIEEMSPGTYQSTMNPQHPVLVQGHWQDPTLQEHIKHHNVHQLQSHLSEMKSQQKTKSVKAANIDYSKSLYTQPTVKRVLVFPNGESPSQAQYVWGESISQILHNAATRLNIRRELKYLFHLTGQMVKDIEEVERDMLLAVSSTKTFQRVSDSTQNVHVKASWARTRKQHGPQSTDLIVRSQRNPNIDVDPFGPSEIAGGPTYQDQDYED